MDADSIRETYDQLVSLGYGNSRALAATMVKMTLLQMTSKLSHCKSPEDGRTVSVGIGAYSQDEPDFLFLHDEILLPSWKNFAETLSLVPANKTGYIDLLFMQVRLDKVVSDLLLQSFKTAPLRTLSLLNNGLGREGLTFVANVLKVAANVETLHLENNPIRSGSVALYLAQTLSKHPAISDVTLKNCRLGPNKAVMAAIVPALRHLKRVHLDGNSIGGTHGAYIISKLLKSNPGIEQLDLGNNLLDEVDAFWLAKSLKTNNKLRLLRLVGNNISERGMALLSLSVLDDSSMNAMYDCNNTCGIEVGEDFLGGINRHVDHILNKKIKMVAMLRHNIHYLEDVPIEIMTEVLAYAQDHYGYSFSYTRLDTLLRLMRAWNLPLMYTSCIGTKPRRSERRRKRKVMEIMQSNRDPVVCADNWKW